MTDLPVTSRSTDTTIEFVVSAPHSGDGVAVDYSEASTAALLYNTSESRAYGERDALYRVDAGPWMTLAPGSKQSVAIDLSTQTLTMKRAQFADDASISMTVTGVPTGIYAGGTTLTTPGGSVTAEQLAALGVTLLWDSSATWPSGAVVIDREGIWQATGSNTNSRPVSGNANWTLMGGMPYIDRLITAADIASASFWSVDRSTTGLTMVPAPGAGFYAVMSYAVTETSGGTPWALDLDELDFRYGTTSGVSNGRLISFPNSLTIRLTQSVRVMVFASAAFPATANVKVYENEPIVALTTTDASDGGSSGTVEFSVRVYYTIVPIVDFG